jgi:hypothetical protein
MEHDDGETDVASYRVPVMLVNAMKLALLGAVGGWMEVTGNDGIDADTLNTAMLTAVGMAMDIAMTGGAPEEMMQ